MTGESLGALHQRVAQVALREESSSALAEYARVPIAFEVRERFVADGQQLTPEPVQPPWVKDYDALPGEGPASWARRFDLSRWGILSAWVDGERVGGAVVVAGSPGIDMLEGRTDLALLWDIRVAPAWRGRGVGVTLFQAVERWAMARGATRLKVETQSVNVPACRFYARMGCELGAINRLAYPDLPDEVQLLWYKSLETH